MKTRRRRKASIPSMLVWNRRDQLRFIEAMERFASLVNDLERILAPVKRRRKLDPPAESKPPTA